MKVKARTILKFHKNTMGKTRPVSVFGLNIPVVCKQKNKNREGTVNKYLN
jgi:hypothetical protein